MLYYVHAQTVKGGEAWEWGLRLGASYLTVSTNLANRSDTNDRKIDSLRITKNFTQTSQIFE